MFQGGTSQFLMGPILEFETNNRTLSRGCWRHGGDSDGRVKSQRWTPLHAPPLSQRDPFLCDQEQGHPQADGRVAAGCPSQASEHLAEIVQEEMLSKSNKRWVILSQSLMGNGTSSFVW